MVQLASLVWWVTKDEEDGTKAHASLSGRPEVLVLSAVAMELHQKFHFTNTSVSLRVEEGSWYHTGRRKAGEKKKIRRLSWNNWEISCKTPTIGQRGRVNPKRKNDLTTSRLRQEVGRQYQRQTLNFRKVYDHFPNDIKNNTIFVGISVFLF